MAVGSLFIGAILGACFGALILGLLISAKSRIEQADGALIAAQAERIRELEQLVGALEESNEKLAIEVAQRTSERDTLMAEHARAMEQLRELDRELARIRNWQEKYSKAKED